MSDSSPIAFRSFGSSLSNWLTRTDSMRAKTPRR